MPTCTRRWTARPNSALRTRVCRLALWVLCTLSTSIGCSSVPTSRPSGPRSPTGAQSEPHCPEFAIERGGDVVDSALKEISGIAASTVLPRALWAHNDSGDRPRLFAIGYDGTVHGEVTLEGADAIDWEDMSAAPGTRGSPRDLIVGDVGDNSRQRDTVQLYRVAEPRLEDLGMRVAVRRFEVRLPDGPQDVEALFVDPVDGAVYLVAKWSGPAADLYRVVLTPESSETLVAEHGGTVPMRLVTAADMSPDGSRLVIRSYDSALLWERAEGSSIVETVKRPPCPVTLPKEPQGEAIAFVDAYTILLLSEYSNQPVYVLTQRGSTGLSLD